MLEAHQFCGRDLDQDFDLDQYLKREQFMSLLGTDHPDALVSKCPFLFYCEVTELPLALAYLRLLGILFSSKNH